MTNKYFYIILYRLDFIKLLSIKPCCYKEDENNDIACIIDSNGWELTDDAYYTLFIRELDGCDGIKQWIKDNYVRLY